MRYFQLFCFLICLCSCKHNVNTFVSEEEAEATLEKLLEEAIYDSFDQVPGISMTVIAPTANINWTGAKGFDSVKKEHELSADQPFRIASVTKSFVATAILRLHEMGQLNIDDPLEQYISAQHLQILSDGGYAPDSITIRQCLNHTNGLMDYAMGGSRAYIDMAKNDPKKRWTRTEQLQLAMQIGPRNGNPGERYAYNDTGYILLGEIIESKMDSTLGYGLRQLLNFDQLGMQSTWLESIDSARSDLPFVHSYFSNLDALQWDPSVDLYGGGGLASTTQNLATFIHGLFNGKVYNQSNTLNLMLEAPSYYPSYDIEEDRRYKDYRQGLWEIEIYGMKAYQHNGLWGSQLIHVPDLNCSIAIHYTKAQRERLAKKTILLIKNLIDQKK